MSTAVQPAAGWTRAHATDWMAALHDDVTALFEELDGGARFREDRWEREGGGGGVSRVMVEGATFEKAGINRSVVFGELPAAALERLGGRAKADATQPFFATGVSLVVHPRSPMIPTVHLNVRYFEVGEPGSPGFDAWFGGGTDLTPTYPVPGDAAHFHRVLRATCDRYHPAFHPRFKQWCDDYFTNPHRGGEARGVGGIFFDHLRAGIGECGLEREALVAFVSDVARVLRDAYGPIVAHRRADAWGERERDFQLFRRGRYVEFNLLHDRGTVFGLQTNARVESVLMSLPPLAAWVYAPTFAPGSFEAQCMAMLAPRDWASAEE